MLLPLLPLTPISLVSLVSLPPPAVLDPLDKPLLFAYLNWEGKARIENGKIVLNAPGLTPKGGAGQNAALDLSEAKGMILSIRLTVGAKNTLKTLKLILRDAKERSATYDFPIGESKGDLTVIPVEGAALDAPNSTEKTGMPDLARIVQWQIQGDWSGDGPVDVIVRSIDIVKPGEAAKAAQAQKAKREEDERLQKERERADLRARYGKRTPLSPKVTRISRVAPDILSIAIVEGRRIGGGMEIYSPQPGDAIKDEKVGPQNKFLSKTLLRNGQQIGRLIGPKRDHLVLFESVEGDPLLEEFAGDPKQFALAKANGEKIVVASVYRKSKPTDWAQPSRGFVMRHTIYLRTEKRLESGDYSLQFGDLNVSEARRAFSLSDATPSEAVHVNQIGYRPDDPAKQAFLSVWLGTGGVLRYSDGLKFHLLDSKNVPVYTGDVLLGVDADTKEPMWRKDNFSKTSVYRLDFSNFATPGKYCVAVEGVGASYPFEIGAKAWDAALRTQLRGLFNERSGTELGPPYTDFKKPRDMYPGANFTVTQSTYNTLSKGGEAWDDIVQGDTGKPVPNAWGGYHDAGDWNPRRATHLKVTQNQLELVDLFPQKMKSLSLNIPKRQALDKGGKKTDIPDILTEALFEIDCFRRLQWENGAIPYGIETQGDPLPSEVSWLQSMPAFVLAPDPYSADTYVVSAARIARLMTPDFPKEAKGYLASATRAFAWAEAEIERMGARTDKSKLRWEGWDARNLAALELFRATGGKAYLDIFGQNTFLKDPNGKIFAWGDHVQRDAAFAYLLIDPKATDPEMRKVALREIEAQASSALDYASGNAFHLTTPDHGKPMIVGFYSTPDAVELCRAHYLTKKREYLEGALRATGFGGGANPMNQTLTTGLGANPIQNPLHLDSRYSGQKAPEGLTVYGIHDFVGFNDSFGTWPITYYLSKICVPSAWDWPMNETYWDIFLYPAQSEFTVDMWSPNVFVWGYLAGRK